MTSAPTPLAAMPSGLPAAYQPVVLIVDDNAPSRAVARHAVSPIGAQIFEAGGAEEAWAAIDEALPDVILLDLMMPDIDGMTFARLVRADPRLCEVPIIMVTAATGRAERLAALEAGVDDFISKPIDRIELRARVATACRLARFRKLNEERQRSAALVALAPMSVIVVDAGSSAVRFLNERAVAWLPEVSLGEPLLARVDQASGAQLRAWLSATEDEELATQRWTVGSRQCDVAAGRVNWDGTAALQLVLTDVTAMARVEEQLHRRDRLDAVGRLAASVAHDFATVVQICQLHVHRAKQEPLTEPLATSLADLGEALRRGGLITQDLLRFCRRPAETSDPNGSCDATAVLRGLERMLVRLSPPSIETVVRYPSESLTIALAGHELEQAIVNLVSNARDSIHRSGRIEVVLEHIDGLARIGVTDNGTGMTADVAARAGEPFFSTKDAGQGTGLGLWMVHRVAEQAGGTVALRSQRGEGTTVTMVLPATAAGTER